MSSALSHQLSASYSSILCCLTWWWHTKNNELLSTVTCLQKHKIRAMTCYFSGILNQELFFCSVKFFSDGRNFRSCKCVQPKTESPLGYISLTDNCRLKQKSTFRTAFIPFSSVLLRILGFCWQNQDVEFLLQRTALSSPSLLEWHKKWLFSLFSHNN